MQNWLDYECLKLPPKTTRARKKRQGARLAENENKMYVWIKGVSLLALFCIVGTNGVMVN